MNQEKSKKFTVDPMTGCLPEGDAKRYFTVVGFSVFALMLVYYLSSIALSYLLWGFAPSLAENKIVSHLFSLLPLYGLGVPVFAVILRRLPRVTPIDDTVGGKRFFGGLGAVIVAMMAGNYISGILITFFEMAMGREQTNPVAEVTSGAAWWINLIFVALVPCILEELVFRKLLCDRLLPLGEGYAVVISAAVFGLVHGNFFQFFYAFAVGLIFATVYVKTGKLWITMVYHGLINFMGGVIAPILLGRLAPLMTEETLLRMEKLIEAGNADGLMELFGPFLPALAGLLVYELVMLAAMIGGTAYLIIVGKKIRFTQGLLPVPRSCRVSAVLLNGGTAAALAVFAGIFLLSLL